MMHISLPLAMVMALAVEKEIHHVITFSYFCFYNFLWFAIANGSLKGNDSGNGNGIGLGNDIDC
jgi:hypothetical protein